MKIWGLVFAIALGIATLLLATTNVPERLQGHSIAHPEFAGMQQSGADAKPDTDLLWIGWSFGALQIALFTAMLALGARSRSGLRGLGLPLTAGLVVHLAIWTALVLTYRTQLNAEDPALFLGFPASTAWMLFALWPCPVIFIFYYVFGFDRWIATPEDLAELERTLARLRDESKSLDEKADR
jgi:hypothetical protein